MISLFKIIYAFVEDKIILKKSWSETGKRVSGYVKEDPIFRVGESIIKSGESIIKSITQIDKGFRKNNDS